MKEEGLNLPLDVVSLSLKGILIAFPGSSVRSRTRVSLIFQFSNGLTICSAVLVSSQSNITIWEISLMRQVLLDYLIPLFKTNPL
jgi:hypothetical protein